MNMFDDIREKITLQLSDWIKVKDPKNQWTIESFAEMNYDEEKIKPHCVTCTIVNHCWFKNEENKKPDEFDYSKYSLAEIPLTKRGLYHPNCHDEKIPISAPNPSNITIFDLERRMDYLFEKKGDWLKSWGYILKIKKKFFRFWKD